MKKSSKYLIFVLCTVIIILNSCNEFNDVDTDAKNEGIEINIPGKADIGYSDLFDTVYYMQLETRRESFIRRIDKIIPRNNTFYILDIQSKQISHYSASDGAFLSHYNSIGDGIGQFVMPIDMSYDSVLSEVLVYDRNEKNSKILYFDTLLNFKREKIIPFYLSEISVINTAERSYLMNVEYEPSNSIKSKLIITDSNFKVEKEFIPFKDGLSFFLSGIDGNGRIGKDLYLPHYSSVFYSKDYLDSFKAKYNITFEQSRIMPPTVAKKLNGSNYSELIDGGNYITNVNFADNKDYILISYAQKEDLYTAFYSIATGSTKVLKLLKNPSCGCGSIYYYKTFDRNNLIGVVEPGNLKMFDKLLGNKGNLDFSIDSISSFNNSGNLVLVIGRLNPF